MLVGNTHNYRKYSCHQGIAKYRINHENQISTFLREHLRIGAEATRVLDLSHNEYSTGTMMRALCRYMWLAQTRGLSQKLC